MAQATSDNPISSLSALWIRATVFGSMWGALEITVGTFLHALKVPFSGVWMAGVGAMLLIVGLRIYPTRGLAWRAGIVCMMLKLISPGVVIVLPMASILLEALIVEAVVLNGRLTFGKALLAGAVCTLSVIPQAVVYYYFVFGWTLFEIYIRLINQTIRFLGGDERLGLWALALILLITALIGAGFGFFGYRLGSRVVEIRREASDA
jgi:hypothetical protein